MNEQRWTVGSLAQSGAEVLKKKQIDSPRLDSDLLLAHVLQLSRLDLFTRFDMPVDDSQRADFRALIKRRLNYEPVAYILGRKEFLDYEFLVGPGVLIPRPETEHVVHAGLKFIEEVSNPRIVEVGVGSGCIGLSILKQHPGAQVLACDISNEAIDFAMRNAQALNVADRFEIRKSDVFQALQDIPSWRTGIDLIVSNPPYIKSEERADLAPDVRDFEPAVALFCQEDGLSFHRRILLEGRSMLTEAGGVVMELGAGDGEALVAFAESSFPGTQNTVLSDYAGHDRVFCYTPNRWPKGFSGLHGFQSESIPERE